MLKVVVIDRCEYCDGEAYLYVGEYKDGDVERPVYQACQACKGSGELEKPISLREFADLLDHATAMEPDWAELAVFAQSTSHEFLLLPLDADQQRY
jgi:hypothetical protein